MAPPSFTDLVILLLNDAGTLKQVSPCLNFLHHCLSSLEHRRKLAAVIQQQICVILPDSVLSSETAEVQLKLGE